MKNLLYFVQSGTCGIVDEIDRVDYPNFTIPGNEGVKLPLDGIAQLKQSGVGFGPVSTVAVSTLLLMAPWSIALAAAAAVAARPALAQLLASDPKKTPEPELVAKGEQEFYSFVRENGITIATAKKRGYIFPPGHPQVGGTYIQHPLAELRGANKEAVYIPADMFDEILLQERECELLKLLVELGASRICITEKTADEHRREDVASVSGGSKAAAAQADLSASWKTSKDSEVGNQRSYSLAGREWRQGAQLDSSKFAWVHFEPSWGALVYAREVGGCLSATLEITAKTTFSLDIGLTAAVKTKLYNGDGEFAHKERYMRSRAFIVEAEFVPWSHASSPS